jgi:hypothetical protein
MTTRRVLISPGASSPLRVSVAGVDASGAQFDDLLFDANQPPMRLYVNGWGRVPYTAPGDGNILQWVRLALLPSTPSGTFPLFMTMNYQPNLTTPGSEGAYFPNYSPYGTTPSFATSQGGGGAVGDGWFTGISFNKQNTLPSGAANPNFPDQTHIAYAIFRNYQ